MLVLGINELYHDTSAALVEDGKLVAVVEEERLNRVKHTPGLCWGGTAPEASIRWVLDAFGVSERDVDAVALSYDMNGFLAVKTVVDALASNLMRMTPRDVIEQRVRGGDHAAAVLKGNLVDYFTLRRRWLAGLRRRFRRVVPIPHHLAHAASAFRMSGFEEANVLVVDGLGEDDSTSLYHGRGNRIEGPFRRWSQYQSLGMFYKTVTFLLGFGYFGDGKTMGLSSYGHFREEWGDMVEADPPGDPGGYRIHLGRMKRLSPYARRRGQPLTDDHRDIAHTVQAQLERALVALARGLHERTGSRKLALAGGVALNCNANAELRRQPFVEGLFVQPGAMDMGTAIGAALELSARLGVEALDPLEHVYYGPELGDVEAALRASGLRARRYEDEESLYREVAERLARGEVVGWAQGRLEFGPRALGNRSILASPASTEIRDRVNRIKQRELWRPLAPAVLEERVGEWFEEPGPSPFMTLTFRFRPGVGERVPGVVHVDGTARIQTVSARTNPRFHGLLRAFERLTGLPMVINTSFNQRGEPIVATAQDAIRTFRRSGLDALVLGNHLLHREQSP